MRAAIRLNTVDETNVPPRGHAVAFLHAVRTGSRTSCYLQGLRRDFWPPSSAGESEPHRGGVAVSTGRRRLSPTNGRSAATRFGDGPVRLRRRWRIVSFDNITTATDTYAVSAVRPNRLALRLIAGSTSPSASAEQSVHSSREFGGVRNCGKIADAASRSGQQGSSLSPRCC